MEAMVHDVGMGASQTMTANFKPPRCVGLFLVSIATVLLAGCNSFSSTTPRTRAQAEELSSLSIFDEASITGWEQGPKRVNVQKTGGITNTGGSRSSQSWSPSSPDEPVEPLLDHLLERAVADGYDVDECDLDQDLGSDGFATLRLATGDSGFVSSITGRRSTQNFDYVVTAWAQPIACSVENTSPRPRTPDVSDTSPRAVLSDRMEKALDDLSTRDLTEDEFQLEMESRFDDFDTEDIRTSIVQSRRAVAIAAGPLCLYGLTTDPITVWEPLTNSTGDECTADEASQGGP